MILYIANTNVIHIQIHKFIGIMKKEVQQKHVACHLLKHILTGISCYCKLLWKLFYDDPLHNAVLAHSSITNIVCLKSIITSIIIHDGT